ncbi:MAG: hypothetical protein ACXIVF_05695 [Rhizobiaceae bacterium]
MEGSLAIEDNRAALMRIVETLVDMAGFAAGPHPEARSEAEPRRTIPRILWRAIVNMLRPAEAAARRLIIAAARGMAVPAPRPRRIVPAPATDAAQRRRLGLAVMVAPGAPRPAKADGGAGINGKAVPRIPALPLFDPPRRIALFGRRRTVPPHAAPRIMVPGITAPRRLPPPPAPGDLVSAERLILRLAALSAALEDLPGQARRYVRLRSRLARGGGRRPWPLRRGRPPGGRLFRYDPGATHPPGTREVDEILVHAHSLALYALESPDTS